MRVGTGNVTWRQLPAGVWVLGFVSMLMDISSEMIRSLLPLFMVSSLGASALAVGVVEGLAEATALIIKVFSGTLSDYLGNRKRLAVLGYAMQALSKPLFATALSTGMVLTARLLERIGEGIRTAPRDALVADVTPAHLHGAAFGLRQSLAIVGALLGPLLAIGLMLLWANDFRAVFWVAVAPGLMAVALLFVGLREPQGRLASRGRVSAIRRDSLGRLGTPYWWLVGTGAAFTLARFSEAFLVLRALEGGFGITFAPLVLAVMSLFYVLSTYPFGTLLERMSSTRRLALGLGVLIAADLTLASSSHWLAVLGGAALWGVHMGLTQGLFAATVVDAVPVQLRDTAHSLFSLVSGIAMIVASALAGLLWDRFGAPATFCAGAFFCLVALMGLLWRSMRH